MTLSRFEIVSIQEEAKALLLATAIYEDDSANLHLHQPSGRHVPLPDHLAKMHAGAKRASKYVGDKASSVPPHFVPKLHAKAAKTHHGVAQHMHDAGFHGLGNQHDAWAQWHHHTSQQHSKPVAPEPNKQPSAPATQKAPKDEPKVPKTPKAPGHSADMPAHLSKAASRAWTRSHEAKHLHYSKDVLPDEKLHAHVSAFKAHVHAASELRRHGYEKHAAEHDTHAQAHLRATRYFRDPQAHKSEKKKKKSDNPGIVASFVKGFHKGAGH